MATVKQKEAIKNVVENGGIISKAMLDAGYSPNTAKTPQKLTESKAWEELMKKFISDEDLAKAHKQLLDATRIEHMVFPLKITDEEIKELLEEVNCKVRKIQHGDTANHCWFWAKDNNALKNGLDLAYKLKGKYAPEKKDLTSLGERIQGIEMITPNYGSDNSKTDNQAVSSVGSTEN